MFSHDKLMVYQESLQFAAETAAMIEEWDRKDAFADHLSRATESILLNLAEGCRSDSLKAKQLSVDYCLGSVLECAACLDIAVVKNLLRHDVALKKKQQLAGVLGKLIGLRKSWVERGVREEGGEYRVDRGGATTVFHHEKLDIYQVALQVLREVTSAGLLDRLPSAEFRRIDETLTSIVLNIAEGHGRFAELDQYRFMQIANRATVRLDVLLDLCIARGAWTTSDAVKTKELLVRVAEMSAAMARHREC